MLLFRAFFSLTTLYMLAILLRWFAPYIEINLDFGPFRYIGKIVDPFVKRVRAVLPSLGPVDFAPIVSILIVWIIKNVGISVLG